MHFTGTSAFLLTPFVRDTPDFAALEHILEHVVGMDSVGILGLTGS